MAGSVLTFDDRDLRRLGLRGRDIARLGDTAPLMREIAASMEAWTQHRFETERAPDGTPWKRSRRAIEEGGQTLTKSARLRQSLSHRSSAKTAETGTNVVYAGVHQEGAVIRPKNAKALVFRVGGRFVTAQKVEIPARPFLGIGPEDDRELGEIVGEFLAGGFSGPDAGVPA